MRVLMVLMIAIVMAFCTSALADCGLDASMAAHCDNEYTSGVHTCRAMHPDPLDTSDLRMCITFSQDVYKKCMAWLHQSPCDWQH
jgi:hypothetical protein